MGSGDALGNYRKESQGRFGYDRRSDAERARAAYRGLKEKLLAAKSAGIKTVLVPKANQADVEELSAEITKGMEILFVESMDEVLKAAMGRKRK